MFRQQLTVIPRVACAVLITFVVVELGGVKRDRIATATSNTVLQSRKAEISSHALFETISVRLKRVLLHIFEVGDGGVTPEGAGVSHHKRDEGKRSEERLVHCAGVRGIIQIEESYERRCLCVAVYSESYEVCGMHV